MATYKSVLNLPPDQAEAFRLRRRETQRQWYQKQKALKALEAAKAAPQVDLVEPSIDQQTPHMVAAVKKTRKRKGLDHIEPRPVDQLTELEQFKIAAIRSALLHELAHTPDNSVRQHAAARAFILEKEEEYGAQLMRDAGLYSKIVKSSPRGAPTREYVYPEFSELCLEFDYRAYSQIEGVMIGPVTHLHSIHTFKRLTPALKVAVEREWIKRELWIRGKKD